MATRAKFFLLGLFLGGFLFGPEVLAMQDLLKSWEKSVWKVSIRQENSAVEEETGTAFVVDSGGFLVTSLRMLAPAIESPEKFQILVHLAEGPVLAQIQSIDAASDLCLLRVARTFSESINFTDAGKTDKVAVLGFTGNGKLGIAEGSSVSELTTLGKSVLRISAFSHPEMRGGLVLNAEGKPLGMLRKVKGASDISLVSGISDLRKLIANRSAPTRSPSSNQTLKERIADDVLKLQRAFALSGDRESFYKEIAFGNFQLKLPLAESGCVKDKAGALNCKSTSIFDFDKSLLLSRSETFLSEGEVDTSLSRIFIGDKERSLASIQGELLCEARKVKNRTGISVVAKFCARPVSGYSDLYNSEIKIETVNAPKFFLRQSIWGVSLEAAAVFTEDLIENLKKANSR